mgnify:FL=1
MALLGTYIMVYIWIFVATLFSVSMCLDQIVVIWGHKSDVRIIQSSECDCLQDVVVIHPDIVATAAIADSDMCVENRIVYSVNSPHFPQHSRMWAYSVNAEGSSDADVLAVNLGGVLRRARVVLYTSFLMQFVPDTEADAGDSSQQAPYKSRDAVFVLREGQEVASVVHQFLARHVPASFLRDPSAPDSVVSQVSEGYREIYEHVYSRLQYEVPLREALRRRAARTLAVYRHMCPAGVNIGVGEKRFGVVDRHNVPVSSGMCVDINVGEETGGWYSADHAGERERALFRPCCEHWVLLDLNTLDITDAADFSALLGPDPALSVARIRAEHVWEHLR